MLHWIPRLDCCLYYTYWKVIARISAVHFQYRHCTGIGATVIANTSRLSILDQGRCISDSIRSQRRNIWKMNKHVSHGINAKLSALFDKIQAYQPNLILFDKFDLFGQ